MAGKKKRIKREPDYYKMFKEKVISRAVYECALEKFKKRFKK